MRIVLSLAYLLVTSIAFAAEPLPSWNDGPTRDAIIAFVKKVTQKDGADYVAPSDRIATIDNDGTLWSEQPAYFQLFFALDRVRAMAKDHPEWKTEQPFKAVLENDHKTLLASGKDGLLKIVAVTHSGMSTEEFAGFAREWLKTAKHPTTGRPYTEMVFQPMLELLGYLRENEFKTFIVSGGGIEFIRVFSEEIYGVPPEQVVGSSVKTKFVVQDGQPTIQRLPDVSFIDDGPGKPIGINQHIGRRPILAIGNSDGDFEMLQWTTSGPGLRLGGIVHHTDAEREWAYDRDSKIGKLARGLDEAKQRGWLLIDMKRDWKTIYPKVDN